MRWLVVIAVCIVSGSALAQETTTLHVESRLVSLDVVVTDDQGKPVAGLGKDDFTIREDGKIQAIHTLDSWEKRPEIPEKASVDAFGRASWGESPLAILVLDNISTEFGDSAYAASMLKRYLRAQPAMMPVPTMLLLVTDRGYKTLAEFTRDRESLVTAVDKRPPSLPSRLGRNDTDVITVQTFLILQQIALAEAGLQQHKSIIWVGAGFPAFDPDSLDEVSEASLKKAIKSTVDLLMDTHTTVYKIDPVPSTTSTAATVDQSATFDLGSSEGDLMAAPEDPLADNFNFNQFAVSTGGKYFYGQNDLDRFFRRAIEQTDEFYTLTYRPPAEDASLPEAYRKIAVTVNRPGLHVTTRQGYYSNEAPEPPPTNKELGASLIAVATGDMNFTGVGVRVINVKPGEAHGTVFVTYGIEERTLQWTATSDGKEIADATAVLVELDAKHNIVGSNAYRLRPYLAGDHVRERFTGTLTARDKTTISSKTTKLRLIVRDSSGRIGTATISAEAFEPPPVAATKR